MEDIDEIFQEMNELGLSVGFDKNRRKTMGAGKRKKKMKKEEKEKALEVELEEPDELKLEEDREEEKEGEEKLEVESRNGELSKKAPVSELWRKYISDTMSKKSSFEKEEFSQLETPSLTKPTEAPE